MVGDGAVGKTSLVKKYSENTFRDDYLPTIGSGFATKRLTLDGIEVTYQIWDMGGQPQFKVVRQNFYRGARGVVYVFDISRRETLDNLEKWREEVSETCGEVPNILIGNKIDLPRKVEAQEGKQYGQCFNAPYFEASLPLNTNIDECFESIGKLILRRAESLQGPPIKKPITACPDNTTTSKEII
ncbi:MAG: GTP-binding protein [Candidatus Freyarchaeum deiterrae]